MQSFLDLNDDGIRHVFRLITNAATFLSLARSSARLWGIASSEVHDRWLSFYAHKFHLNEFELQISCPNLDWHTCFRDRIIRLHRLKSAVPDTPLLLPAPTNLTSTPPPPLNSLNNVLALTRSNEQNGSPRTASPQDVESLQSLLLWFADIPNMSVVPVELNKEKAKALIRWIEEPGALLSVNPPRLRLLQHFEGLNIVVSAISYLNSQGRAYDEAQDCLMTFLVLLEMSSESLRPVRPHGCLLPLRHQLIHPSRMENRKLALTLLWRYGLHEETMNKVLAPLDLILPVSVYLYDSASPAVICSVSILSSVESEEGMRQIRSIPNISSRVMELLSWDVHFSIVSGALTLLRTLDLTELIPLGVIPATLRLVPVCLEHGLESLALLALLNLKWLVCSPPSLPSITFSDIMADLLSTLRQLEHSPTNVKHKPAIKALLAVIIQLCQCPGDPQVAYNMSRQFRSLSGHFLLQELASTYDYSRRMSQASAREKLLSIQSLFAKQSNQPMNEEIFDGMASGDKNSSFFVSSSSILISPDHDLLSLGLPSRDLILGMRAGGNVQNSPDVVTEVYLALVCASEDLLVDSQDQQEGLDYLASDILWLCNCIAYHLTKSPLVHASLRYMKLVLSMVSLQPPQAQLISNVVLLALHYLQPTWHLSTALTLPPASSPLLPSPDGPEIVHECLSIIAVLIQSIVPPLHTKASLLSNVPSLNSSLGTTPTNLNFALHFLPVFNLVLEHLRTGDFAFRLYIPTMAFFFQYARSLAQTGNETMLRIMRQKLEELPHHVWSISVFQHDPILHLYFTLLYYTLPSPSMDTNHPDILLPELNIPEITLPLILHLDTLLPLLLSASPGASTAAIVALSSFTTTPKGRSALATLLHLEQGLASLPSASHASSTFWHRVLDLLALHEQP